MDDKEIRDLFAKYEVPLGRKDVWAVQGTPVIKHSALERLSAKLGLTWDMPREVIASMQDVVILARATRKDGISEWSYGEASIVREGVIGGNYKVSGKQASYVFAMAEKRAKDRVIVKLAGLHGAYSEEEADDFNQRNADGASGRRGGFQDEQPADRGSEDEGRDETSAEPEKPAAAPETPPEPGKAATARRTASKAKADPKPETKSEAKPDPAPANDDEPADVKALRKSIRDASTVNAVTDLMLAAETQTLLSKQTNDLRTNLRDAAKARLVELGWPGKAAA